MRARHVIGVVAVIGLGACSSPAPAKVAAKAPTAQAAALPPCKDVFVVGKPVDKAKATAGCTSPSGGEVQIGAIDCTDATALWQVDASTGAPAGYARDGQTYQLVKGEIASDAAYKKAYESCVK
ncbi:hypothetical protein [Actinoplanes sp. NPDC026619]|uniref:hypothetical protein n=1 Tax=Actinoplanes sp. NPDC026619 TaxID=3155798 RepID=UPI0033EE4037